MKTRTPRRQCPSCLRQATIQPDRDNCRSCEQDIVMPGQWVRRGNTLVQVVAA